jgi:hypothetical protein
MATHPKKLATHLCVATPWLRTTAIDDGNVVFSSIDRKTFLHTVKLCTMITLGTQNLWPLLTGGRCSEVVLCYKN